MPIALAMNVLCAGRGLWIAIERIDPMNLSFLSRQSRRSLFAYLRKVMRRKQPEIDRLERELKRRRAAHRSTRVVAAKLRDTMIQQLRQEVSNV